jgi:hypothetical protein
VLSAVPESLRPAIPAAAPARRSWGPLEEPLRRYLAARAFASWVAVQGPGLRTAVRALRAALAVVRVEIARLERPWDATALQEALRRSDLLLIHLASPEALAATLGRCETAP